MLIDIAKYYNSIFISNYKNLVTLELKKNSGQPLWSGPMALHWAPGTLSAPGVMEGWGTPHSQASSKYSSSAACFFHLSL